MVWERRIFSCFTVLQFWIDLDTHDKEKKKIAKGNRNRSLQDTCLHNSSQGEAGLSEEEGDL